MRRWIVRAADVVGSVPVGVGLMALLLIYAWIGSAGLAPLVEWFPRQSLEMTELQWFNWWPFQLLMAAMSLSLVLVTWRRIRFSLPNLGVFLIHGGVLVLTLGCAIYFARKQEGDVAVYRQSIALSAGQQASVLWPQPGARAFVYGEGRFYDVRVVSTQADYELLTGTDRGRKAFVTQIAVQPYYDGKPGPPFVRQLIEGFPQYTEDVLPGQGRAIKALGRAIVDDAFSATLQPFAADRFYLRDSAAIAVRVAGTETWDERELHGLPRYREWLADPAAVSAPEAEPIRPRPLALIPVSDPSDSSHPPLELELRVTGFLPHAALAPKLPPAVIPRAERDTKAGLARAVVRVEVRHRDGDWRSAWVPYSHFPHPNRYGYHPTKLKLADGSSCELLFTRAGRPLGMKLALADFQLETYPGGQRERDFISRLRIDEGNGWSEPVEIRSNVPTAAGGWWLFQSTWDPPMPQSGYGGLNFSGVGVGNRHGVWVMLLGAALISIGLVWAFYVKPVLRQRRQRARRQTIEAATPEGVSELDANRPVEPADAEVIA